MPVIRTASNSQARPPSTMNIMSRSTEKDWSRGEAFLRHFVELRAFDAVVTLLVLFVAAVVLLFQGHYWEGGGLLATLLVAWGAAFAVSRKSPRNPRRYAKARQARKQRREESALWERTRDV